MNDERLSALKEAVLREEWEFQCGSYRDVALTVNTLERLSFWDVYWSSTDGTEWQRLKYCVSAFVKPAAGDLEGDTVDF